MRTKIIATIITVMVSFVAFSQQRSVASVLKELNPSEFPDTILSQAKINEAFFYTNHCLNQFRKDNMIAYYSTVVGLGCIAFGSIGSFNGTDSANEVLNRKILSAEGSISKLISAQKVWEKRMNEIEEKSNILNTIGVCLVVGGGVLHIVSYRWLKNAYVYPTQNGASVGVKINF